MNRAIFLDRDGTINVEKNYLYRIEEFEYISGVIEGLKILQELDFRLIIITNQSGIARGYYTEDEFLDLNMWMMQDFRKKGIHIENVYYCPHHPNAVISQYKRDCRCRKPQLALFEQAIEDYNIDIRKSYAIGDKLRDLKICESGCRGFLVGYNEEENIITEIKNGKYSNVSWHKSLLSCAKDIKDIEENEQ